MHASPKPHVQLAETPAAETPAGRETGAAHDTRRASDTSAKVAFAASKGLRAIAASSILVFHIWDFGAGAPGQPALDYDIAHKFLSNLRAGFTLSSS